MGDEQVYRLSDFKEGTRCLIYKIHGHGGFRHRLTELGFVPNEVVRVVKNAPLLDPVEYEIMGTHISLRRSEACNVEVVPIDSHYHNDFASDHGSLEDHVTQEVIERRRSIYVALVGNPNCGKTTLFNFATHRHEKVGNYGGVTVDIKKASYTYDGYTIHLIDLPGTYSLTGASPDEQCVMDFLIKDKVDVVLNVADATNLQRNLYLTTQLVELNLPMVAALNMYDDLRRHNRILDYKQLSHLFGVPIVPINAKKGHGVDEMTQQVIAIYENRASVKHVHFNYGSTIEKAIDNIKSLVFTNTTVGNILPGRFWAVQLLDEDNKVRTLAESFSNYSEIEQRIRYWHQKIESEYDNDSHTVITEVKYAFIRGALMETLSQTRTCQKKEWGFALDTVLTNKWCGIPLLLLFLYGIFQVTFSLGGVFQAYIGEFITWLSSLVELYLSDGMLKDLLVEGIFMGVGGVLLFLPNILILFFFISIFEDTGYMARIAFLTDKLMHRVGLHGKSFIPYILGLGCTVPAIMGARILENPKDRIITIVTVPFMSCSTRLAVYLLVIGSFFDHHQALILLVLYVLGAIVALLTAAILNKFVFHGVDDSFIMELPSYRMPSLKNTLVHMWDRAVQYLKNVSTAVVLTSVIIWALSYFPGGVDHTGTVEDRIENSYISSVGHAIEPVFSLIGVGWRESVSLIAGFSAKEIFISTMNILYDGNIDNSHLSALSAFALLLFIMLYSPCVAALSTIAKETNIRWMLFSFIYSTLIAWFIATLFYQIATAFVTF